MSEVTDALRALQAGERTIEDVEQMFRTRNWPKVVPPADAQEAIARDAIGDPEEPADGSFFEVASAFTNGVIDVDTYERLADAASEAISASDTPPEGAEPPEDPEEPPEAPEDGQEPAEPAADDEET